MEETSQMPSDRTLHSHIIYGWCENNNETNTIGRIPWSQELHTFTYVLHHCCASDGGLAGYTKPAHKQFLIISRLSFVWEAQLAAIQHKVLSLPKYAYTYIHVLNNNLIFQERERGPFLLVLRRQNVTKAFSLIAADTLLMSVSTGPLRSKTSVILGIYTYI